MADTITTLHLSLRRLTMDDVPAMHALFADAQVMAYWSRLPHTDIAETEAWVAETIARVDAGEADDFAVIRDGVLIGRIGIWQDNELGLIFARAAWGTGAAREAADALIARARARGAALAHGRYRPAQRPCRAIPAEARFPEDRRGQEHLQTRRHLDRQRVSNPRSFRKSLELRILVTNDDGIHAPGLAAAEKIARALTDDVWIVAPETEQSGASHSLTLIDAAAPARDRRARFAVTGTPTDCVMMACAHVMKDAPPTLILSGVNRGSNIADDVTYSGTIAGAMEGCALGIPSIAMSQSYGFEPKARDPLGLRRDAGPAADPQAGRDRLAGRRADEHQLSRLRAGRRERHRDHDAGQARPADRGARPAHRRARHSLFLDRLQARAQQSAGGHRSARDLRQAHLGHAAASEPDRTRRGRSACAGPSPQ